MVLRFRLGYSLGDGRGRLLSLSSPESPVSNPVLDGALCQLMPPVQTGNRDVRAAVGRAMITGEDRVRAYAYRLWEQEGRPEGRAQIHWQMAEIAIALWDRLDASEQKGTVNLATGDKGMLLRRS